MYWKSKLPGAQAAISFSSLYHAHLMLDFWALQLALSYTIDVICNQVQNEITTSMRQFVEKLKLVHNPRRHNELATNIMSSLPFCMNDENGLASSQKCLFAGRVALFSLRSHSSENLASYEAIFMELTHRKGLRYAQDISQDMKSSWTAELAERGRDLRKRRNDLD